jgi:hypothetical protein
MNDAARVEVFHPRHNLKEKVFDVLILELPGGKKTIQVHAKEVGYEVNIKSLI